MSIVVVAAYRRDATSVHHAGYHRSLWDEDINSSFRDFVFFDLLAYSQALLLLLTRYYRVVHGNVTDANRSSMQSVEHSGKFRAG
eukprot:6029101-Amphidinium_carterae.2